MGTQIELTEAERNLANELREALSRWRSEFNGSRSVKPATTAEMAEVAHRLHMSLAGRGQEPIHHKYMLENRGVPPTEMEFYLHVHPVEDLLAYLADRDANKDPEDVTVGHEFAMDIYSRRWGHDDRYRVQRTKAGWVFSHMESVDTGRDGRVGGKSGTGLFHLLDHDSINYPEELPGYLEWLWEQAAEEGLRDEELAEGLALLAGWINVCEKSSPAGIFQGYK